MEEQEEYGLPPELARLLTPEYQREMEKRDRENMEIRVRAESHLQNARKILDGLKR
jgi:hypothetical protein